MRTVGGNGGTQRDVVPPFTRGWDGALRGGSKVGRFRKSGPICCPRLKNRKWFAVLGRRRFGMAALVNRGRFWIFFLKVP